MPKGKLLIIGGAEDKGTIRNPPLIKLKNKNFVDFEILGSLIHESEGNNRIEVVTTASQQPLATGRTYVRAFRKAGFSNVGHIDIGNKEDLKDPSHIDRAASARVIFFSGGDQYRLTSIFGGSEFLTFICNRYRQDPDFVLAGTSAGAMAMSEHMIYYAENNEAMLKGHVKITHGFGLLPDCIVDTHFAKRGRFGRLFQAVMMNDGSFGVGLGEDTALLVDAEDIGTCIGSGMTVIVDSSNVTYHNKRQIAQDEPISVENLIVHALTRGDRFDFTRRKMLHRTEVTS